MNNKSYEELLSMRDKLYDEIKALEAKSEVDPEDVLVYPSINEQYYDRLHSLSDVCRTIADHYGKN